MKLIALYNLLLVYDIFLQFFFDVIDLLSFGHNLFLFFSGFFVIFLQLLCHSFCLFFLIFHIKNLHFDSLSSGLNLSWINFALLCHMFNIWWFLSDLLGLHLDISCHYFQLFFFYLYLLVFIDNLVFFFFDLLCFFYSFWYLFFGHFQLLIYLLFDIYLVLLLFGLFAQRVLRLSFILFGSWFVDFRRRNFTGYFIYRNVVYVGLLGLLDHFSQIFLSVCFHNYFSLVAFIAPIVKSILC